jgi:hypothetical protein
MTYRAGRAWFFAYAYFSGCWVLSLVVGFGSDRTPMEPFNAGWWFLTVTAVCASAVGYWLLWPIGTTTQGRRLHLWWALLFGISWGLSEGMLLVVVWSPIRDWLSSPLVVILVSIVILGGIVALWHAAVWDRYIAPPHNLAEWNMRKVLGVHLPVLALAIAHLTIYEQVIAFVGIQIIALTGATIAMHFPPPIRSSQEIGSSR